jgi:hypothetical protein
MSPRAGVRRCRYCLLRSRWHLQLDKEDKQALRSIDWSDSDEELGALSWLGRELLYGLG